MLFDYDEHKNKTNKERHGVSLQEASLLWEGTYIIIPAKNIFGEARSAILGQLHGKIYVAIFTKRGETIRLISCHRADNRWERIYYAYIKEKKKKN